MPAHQIDLVGGRVADRIGREAVLVGLAGFGLASAPAAVAVIGTLAALGHQGRDREQRPDLAGTFAVTVGLLGLVFGFSNASQHGWTGAVTTLNARNVTAGSAP